MILNQNEFRIATVAMFTCDLYAGSPPPHDLERLHTTMQRRVVDFVRVGYFIPLNGPLNGQPPSMLLYEPYANDSSQICPFLATRTQFDSDHHQNRRLFSHSYSHESVILLVFLGLIFVKLRRVCVFEFKCMRLSYCSR